MSIRWPLCTHLLSDTCIYIYMYQYSFINVFWFQNCMHEWRAWTCECPFKGVDKWHPCTSKMVEKLDLYPRGNACKHKLNGIKSIPRRGFLHFLLDCFKMLLRIHIWKTILKGFLDLFRYFWCCFKNENNLYVSLFFVAIFNCPSKTRSSCLWVVVLDFFSYFKRFSRCK